MPADDDDKKGTVIVVDDEQANRELFSEILESVGIAHRSYPSALAFLDEYDPSETGCLVIDIRMPGMSGLELQRKLVEERAPQPIIVVTAHGDVPIAIEAMKSGAYDFIEKPIRNQHFLESIQGALRYAHESAGGHQRRADIEQAYNSLTAREREVFKLVADGEPNKRIAYELDISIKTVELHRAKVMQKLEARSLADLVRKAILLGPQSDD